jgi:hypothetical protein
MSGIERLTAGDENYRFPVIKRGSLTVRFGGAEGGAGSYARRTVKVRLDRKGAGA